MRGTYIAEIIQENPLIVKVEEGWTPYCLKDGTGGFVIYEDESAKLQNPDATKFTEVLEEYKKRGYPLRTGLKNFGIEDGLIHEILPED